MTEALDSPSSLQTQLTIGRIGLAFSFYFIVYVLKRIELNNALLSKKKRKLPLFDSTIGHDTALKVSISFSKDHHDGGEYTIHRNDNDENENESNHNKVTSKSSKNESKQHTNGDDDEKSTCTFTTLDLKGHSSEFEAQVHNMAQNPHDYIDYNPSHSSSFEETTNHNGDTKFIRTKLNLEEKLYLYVMVSILLFITYLLLVYLPSGATASLIGTILISCVILKPQLTDDILRRKRYDRVSAIFTLLIFAASSMSLMTYGRIGLQEGMIYEGPARIIGYDTSVYESTTKTNDDDNNNSGKVMKEATRMDLEVAWGGQWGCPDNGGVQCQAFVSGALCEVDEKANEVSNRHHHRRYLEVESNSSNETIQELQDEIEELTKENEELKEKNTQLDEMISDEDEELDAIANTAIDYYEKSNENANDAKYYKDVAVEEAEEIVVDNTATMEEALDAEYYAEVAEAEEEIVENTYGVVGEEVVDEVKDEIRSEFNEAIDEVEDVMEKTIEKIEDAYVNDDVSLGTVEEEVAEAEEEMVGKVLDVTLENEGVIVEDDDVEKKEITEEDDEQDDDTLISVEEGEEIIEEVEEEEEDGSLSVEEGEEIIEEVEEEEEEKKEKVPKKVVEDKNSGNSIDAKYYSYYDDDTNSETSENNKNKYTSYGSNNNYSFEDDMFEDDWWSHSWTDVWGEYTCNDIFDSDLEGKTYDSDVKPGDDEWPFVNIYGSCNRCEAYLVDYYSTEHFNMIKQYQHHAQNYALVGLFGVIITSILIIKQYLSPAEENELGLLMNEGGQDTSRMMV